MARKYRYTREDLFWKYVSMDNPSGCWLWIGGTNGRYGRFCRDIYAHRFSYEMHYGPIPEGLEIDHLCVVPLCVNPNHLEAVTQRENNLRSKSPPIVNMRKTHCKRDHEFDEANTWFRKNGHRNCRRCHAENERSKRHAREMSQ